MNRSIVLLVGLFVSACAGGPATSSPSPTGLPSAATAPGPTPIVTPQSSVLAPVASTPATFAPTATERTTLETRASDSAKNIRLTIEADRVPLVAGMRIDFRLRIENRGTKSVYWLTDGCQNPGLTYVHLNGEAWIGGVEQRGIAATFKAFALEPFGHAGHTQLAIGLPADFPPEGAGCGDVGIVHELKPGKEIEGARHWTGATEDPIPEGPADIVAAFEFWPNTDLDREAKTILEARFATWIESDEVVDYLPPGPAIDAALADPEFRTWLEAADTSGWVNTSHTLDRAEGTWEIGLFRDGGPGFYGGVTIDARTGEVLGHRFE